MAVRRLLVEVPQTAADAVTNYLVEQGVGGIEVRDSTTLEAVDPGRAAIVAFVDDQQIEGAAADLCRYMEALRSVGVEIEPWKVSNEEVADTDWVQHHKAFFSVKHVGERFVVCPAWKRYEAQSSELILRIDPGQAFGTGGHPTTRLCLRAMERIDRLWGAPDSVLDLGCGAGLLAVAAARIWPKSRVLAVDIDPVAITVAQDTAARNGLSSRIGFAEGSISALEGGVDLVLANLEAKTLANLRAEILQHLTPRGRLVMSGLLVAEAEAVVRSYVQDLRTEPEYSEDEEGWRMVVLRRYPRPAAGEVA